MQEIIEFSTSIEEPGFFIRTAVSYSIITKKPIKITNIRDRGLNKEDFMYVKILEQVSNSKSVGLQIGKDEFTFYPNEIDKKMMQINLKSPCVLSILLPHLIFICYNTNSKIRINGPTNKEGKITIDYIKNVIIPMIDKLNIKQKIEIHKRGYNLDIGSVILHTKNTKEIKPLKIEKRGDLEKIYAIMHSYGYSDKLNQYLIDGCTNKLKQHDIKINKIENIFLETKDMYKGYGIDLFAVYENTILGVNDTSIKKQASQLGKEVADKLISIYDKEFVFDKYLSNIILTFLTLSQNQSEIIIPKRDEFINIVVNISSKLLNTKYEFTNNSNCVHVKVN